MTILCLLLSASALSIWDYPSRQQAHDQLRHQFVAAFRGGDTQTMEETCRKGVKLLPDDPTWHYNLACSLAYFPKRTEEAFDELEKAIDLGFRNVEEIKADRDLKRLEGQFRYQQLIEYAKEMQSRPLLFGPMACVDATGIFGSSVALGEQNLGWNFDAGCFTACLKLAVGPLGPWTGDLYFNRDRGHSTLDLAKFPGLTPVRFDSEGRRRGLDMNDPNVIFPYPVFGNSSRAYLNGPYWRSISRALVTSEARKLKTMERLYLSNQVWVFPSNADTPPVGTNGDVFASLTPYWLTTAGRSWSDRPYLTAALHASAAFRKDVKAELVRRGLLAPTIMTLIRKSLGTVTGEDEYTSMRAHPTAFPPSGVSTGRVASAAARLTVAAIPPLVRIAVRTPPVSDRPLWPELTYALPHAWAFVLRSADTNRVFFVSAEEKDADEFRFVQTHGTGVAVSIEQVRPNVAKVTIDRRGMSPVNRVDLAVFGRRAGTGWGAPSYVSFARMDPEAPYSDPVLTPRGDAGRR